MSKLVSIALPIYKRLEYLPHILRLIDSQEYETIELIVSDNGLNGPKVREIVEANYSRPFKFRQNPVTVSMATHLNQILEVAAGEFYMMLADDDEISPNFISELAPLLEQFPKAALAFARQEIIDENGIVIRRGSAELPMSCSGPDFIRKTWQTCEFKFDNLCTFLCRTADVRACGGYPDFAHGNHIDDALVIKLCLSGETLFSGKCCFRWRDVKTSHGWSANIQALASATKDFLRFLDEDKSIRRFAAANAQEWRLLRRCLWQMSWETYLWRWRDIYKNRLPFFSWAKAGLAMPCPEYYRRMMPVLAAAARDVLVNQLRKVWSRRPVPGGA